MVKTVGGDRQSIESANHESRRRAQSEVLAGVIIIGIIFIAAGVVAMIAVNAFASPQDQAIDRAIEESMFSLRSAAVGVGMNGETARTVALQSPNSAHLSINPDATTIRVIHAGYDATNPDAEEVLYEANLGSLTISMADRTYAFEGGAIYRAEDGSTQVIAPPPFVYRGLTANLAIINLDGAGSRGGATSVHIAPGEDRSMQFPNATASYETLAIPYDNPVENGSVKLEIQSEHYEGWYAYFDDRGTGTVSIDHENNTLRWNSNRLAR